MTRRASHGPRAATPVAVGAVLALLAGCTSSPEPSDPPSPTPSAPTSMPDEDQAGDVELPDHAAGRAADWVLTLLAADVGTPVDDAEDRLAPVFLAEISADELTALLDQLRTAGPWTVGSVEGDAEALSVLLSGEGQDLQMQLHVDAEERIDGLFFTEPPPPREEATSWSELTDEVTGLGGSTSLLVATVNDDACVPMEGLPAGSAAGDQLPIGSIVKLYVLGAVADAVGRGELSWQDEVTVVDDLRSLPSGELQDAPTGTSVTVEEAARSMIAISDNTATDLLIHAVGRERVEEAMADMGHGDPAANIPLPTTRELFQIGWGGGTDLREEWRDADSAGRSAILDGLPDGPPEVEPEAVAQVAVWTHDVDWFATAADLCAAHVALAERSEQPHAAVVREILAANPGVDVDADTWPYVAFKGGSAPGTMAGAWYAEDADGSATVVVLQTAAPVPSAAVRAETMVGIATDALRLSRG